VVAIVAALAADSIFIGLLAVPLPAGPRAHAPGGALGWTVGRGRQPLDVTASYNAGAVRIMFATC